MKVPNEPTYEEWVETFGEPIIPTRKEKREYYKLLDLVGLKSDLFYYSISCHKLMPKKLPQNNVQKRNSILKITGERYVGYCIEVWFWEKGYSLNGLMGNSFTIEPQYQWGNHRIDFRVNVKTPDNVISIVVDSKNWARYSSGNAKTFARRHVKSFNSFTTDHKLMFLNKRLIPAVNSILQKNNIKPVMVDEHLTETVYIQRYDILLNSMYNSIENLDNLISLPDISKDKSKLKPVDIIKYDIELGKPYKLIKEKWEITRTYIDNLKNQMKKAGKKLPRRNLKAFTRLKQYNPFFSRK